MTPLRTGLVALALSSPAWAQTTHDIDIPGLSFSPADIVIQVGDTVRWTNSDFNIHTATELNGFLWDSGVLSSGQTFEFTFDATFVANNPVPGGVYDYFCQIHPSMLGTITVQDGLGTLFCSPANANSSGAPASLSASGSPVIASNDVQFEVAGLPTSQFGYFLMSESQATIAISNGILCLGAQQFRFNQFVLNSGATGTMSFSPNLAGGLPSGVALQAGDTWHFTLWFRDGQRSNFSDAISITFE